MFKREIERGAAFLDEHFPGWEDKIDPETLNLEDGCNCILGQVYGAYFKGAEKLGLENIGDRARLGFTLDGGNHFNALTRDWLAYLANRALAPFKRAYTHFGGV